MKPPKTEWLDKSSVYIIAQSIEKVNMTTLELDFNMTACYH
jgi:hypothetical protein